MKHYTVTITPTAENDLASRYHQIAEEAPQHALEWYFGIISAIESLNQMAERCPIAPENVDVQKEIRHLIIGDYRILFCITDNSVKVLHIQT